MKALDLIENDQNLPKKVLDNALHFREKMQHLGFTILGDNHPICPVMLGDARLASQFADEMLKRGIYVIGFSYPVVKIVFFSAKKHRSLPSFRFQKVVHVSVYKFQLLIRKPISIDVSTLSLKSADNFKLSNKTQIHFFSVR